MLARSEFLKAYETMRLIREFEEALLRLHGQAKVPGFVHLSVWQEAVPAGVSLNLRRDDLMISTHRGHGDLIAKGVAVEGMFAELLGRQGGYCRAKGGSMHVTDLTIGALGANGIVGACMPIAAGAALSMKKQGRDAVVVAYVGDGAIANGETHETLNMAVLWCLPLVFVRTDNQYAESTPARTYCGIPDVIRYVEGYGVCAEAVDGNDVDAVAEAAGRAIAHARSGAGPSFLQCSTYRKYGHNTADVGAYRTADEVETWRARDPLDRARGAAAAHSVTAGELEAIDATVAERIEHAIQWAEEQPEPPLDWAFEDVYGDSAVLQAFGGRVR
ncbi:MAG: thiamine pyrophosphate-dependent dehydrogenase E1 component subunit alpha [Candidatus Limnocylindrales bacterium]|jgi:pyruvate dehydrogenase E1 component alpha subunit